MSALRKLGDWMSGRGVDSGGAEDFFAAPEPPDMHAHLLRLRCASCAREFEQHDNHVRPLVVTCPHCAARGVVEGAAELRVLDTYRLRCAACGHLTAVPAEPRPTGGRCEGCGALLKVKPSPPARTGEPL